MSATLHSTAIFADFADGESAQMARVGVRLEPREMPDRLVIVLPDGRKLTWPLEYLRHLPDQADRETLALSVTSDPVARLFLRHGEVNALIRAHARNLSRKKPVENKPRLLKWAAMAIASVALITFVLVPIMADQLARYLPPEGEKALGDTTFEQIRHAMDHSGFDPVRICEAPAGVAALEKMLTRLNPDADLPYPLQVNVLDHDLINAFALPGGRIVFFRGLIEAAETPEEVAAVLAHEIGHVVSRDPTRGALRSAGTIGVLGLLFGDFAGGTVVLFLANHLINASYSQTAEAAADSYAHALLTEAGLSPAALGVMFMRLQEKHGEEAGLVAHFSAHPLLSERIAASLAAAEGIKPTEPVLSEAEWLDLRAICGPDRAPLNAGGRREDTQPLKK